MTSNQSKAMEHLHVEKVIQDGPSQNCSANAETMVTYLCCVINLTVTSHVLPERNNQVTWS